jgi:hypothetical protein
MGARRVLIRAAERTALLAFWTLVLWGGLLLLSTLANALTEGPAAFGRLVPVPGGSIWSWLASLSVLLALAVGLIGGALVLSSARGNGVRS